MSGPIRNCSDDDRTERNIEKYGLSVIILEATAYLPAFAYSIGLWKTLNHPEIICFGLTLKTLHALINDVAELVKRGEVIIASKSYAFFSDDTKTQFIHVDPSYLSNYFGAAINYYGINDFPALQFLWADKNNKLPWDEGYMDEFKYRQPLLDRNIDFKFREVKDLGVFTTRQWLDLGNAILQVVHDDDGDWQFLTANQMPEDIRLVAIEQMTLSDASLNEVFDLDYGEMAEREFIGAKWIRSKLDNDTGQDNS